MGACTFVTSASGETADQAFKSAVRDAAFESGGGGYTGTIAEKETCVMIPMPVGHGDSPSGYAQQLLDEDDERISDKWGPAGCIDLGLGHYLFFGWASE